MEMDVRYPIGKFEWEGEISAEQRERWIQEIEELPGRLREAVAGLTPEQLRLPYRDGGWTITQVVHHLADSHMNSLIRFKLALTEDTPTIRPYYEDRWAELADGVSGQLELSLTLLEALHQKWVILLRSMHEEDFARSFLHPESGSLIRLDYGLGNYVWHGNHHLAHITGVRRRLPL
ncbi:YfiT family bacillithiol transferase [Paenibacillus physcomitrellae]|uniref:Putative metal-dependent hydrolase GCM10010917_39360 n=1 Tax=Paenibacillus physcomitrellae TaxID=1619311 RepID=A0ABQ1GUG3_9BACL|nr:bacillithiol transferase BstA [Paenibacillus physcomitrellae]GGA50248.1 putative metal-dependent hydrolase YfiT [Paenibacillus physcomitrellae]